MHFYRSIDFKLALGAIKEESVTNCLSVNVLLRKTMATFDGDPWSNMVYSD